MDAIRVILGLDPRLLGGILSFAFSGKLCSAKCLFLQRMVGRAHMGIVNLAPSQGRAGQNSDRSLLY
jgi:hypothetical protein